MSGRSFRFWDFFCSARCAQKMPGSSFRSSWSVAFFPSQRQGPGFFFCHQSSDASSAHAIEGFTRPPSTVIFLPSIGVAFLLPFRVQRHCSPGFPFSSRCPFARNFSCPRSSSLISNCSTESAETSSSVPILSFHLTEGPSFPVGHWSYSFFQ